MNPKIAPATDDLRRQPRRELLRLWQELFGRPGTGIRRELLIRCLAYGLQERAYGPPTAEQQMELRRASQIYNQSRQPVGSRCLYEIKPGTRFRRQWRDEIHEVFVTTRGYEYRGVCYRSLSMIARRITKTRWSGPAFFGLKKNRLAEKTT